MINLVKNTISNSEVDLLSDWLKTYPKLTKGEVTEKFEQAWSSWLGRRYSVFVNSGSSANLAMMYALQQSGRLRNNKVIAPCVSWTTTISPLIQLGMEPILCDSSKDNLGLDINHLRKLCEEHKPACILLVHVLGVPNSMSEIEEICKDYEVILLEDSCESVGSTYKGKTTGTFGTMSTFSTYFGHHFSTIEGGLVSTDDFELYEILKSIRSHGWSRDLSEETRAKLREEHNIDTFRDLYSFYYPGFNLRATEVQAFLGLGQIEGLRSKNHVRKFNFSRYQDNIVNDYWKVRVSSGDYISNFAYPIIHPKKDDIVRGLQDNNIECRPLVCGNIARQPYFTKLYGHRDFEFADIVHDYGLYVPNHPDMSTSDVDKVCEVVNEVTR
jgi:CDP-4-dehydro-6-deoxyglucose reductase, E1